MKDSEAILSAESARDSAALRLALGSLDGQVPVDILLRLLPAEWHDSHEDIVFELGLRGAPKAVEPILKAANTPFRSLVEWGNLQEFQRKCAYALARIGTSESKAALESLAQSDDAHLREYGSEGLAHWPLPYRPK